MPVYNSCNKLTEVGANKKPNCAIRPRIQPASTLEVACTNKLKRLWLQLPEEKQLSYGVKLCHLWYCNDSQEKKCLKFCCQLLPYSTCCSLIQRVLVAEGKSCTDETATCISQVLNGDHDKNSFTYICSKCHTKLAHYYDTDYSLMAKLKKSFILNRFTSHDDETSEEEVTTSHDIHLCVPAQTIGEKQRECSSVGHTTPQVVKGQDNLLAKILMYL